ncbi:MAG TPA: redoxin family protein [Gemmataceae bacterium]|jgi:uncharacterized protein (TIGR03067 family)|nr:redoxin family protein [Gemmataceae bacterium]
MSIKPFNMSAVLVLLAGTFLPAADPPTDLAKVAGTWLADAAEADMDRPLGRVWFSRFKIDGDKFHVEKFFFHPKGLSGTFVLDPTTNPKSVDLKVNELDYAELGEPVKLPACTLKSIYKLDGDRLTICFPLDDTSKRPTEFKPGKRIAVLTLGRTKAGFKELPKEVTVTVLGPDGQPVRNATTYYMMHWDDRFPRKDGARPEWKLSPTHATGADGTVKVPYEDVGQGIRACTTDRSLIGFVRTSPFALQTAALTVNLESAVRVMGKIENDELKNAGLPVGMTNATVYLGQNPVASYMTGGGKFDIPLPTGDYTLRVYGENLATKRFPFTVSAGRSELELAPIKPPALALATLKGKPAPELKDVAGWKGEKVALADLKGKVVLLEFWGYWCGPCIHSMPVLFELHDKFKDKGLAIIGVHLDIDGEVDTAVKLDEKLIDIRKQLWKGRDLPFPIVLCSGKQVEVDGGELRRGGVQYGIVGYPTTVLIDREGKVVGTFQARDVASAVKEMERLLGGT